MSMDRWWNDTDCVKPNCSEKTLSPCRYEQHKFHVQWTGIDSVVPWRGRGNKSYIPLTGELWELCTEIGNPQVLHYITVILCNQRDELTKELIKMDLRNLYFLFDDSALTMTDSDRNESDFIEELIQLHAVWSLTLREEHRLRVF